MENISLETSDSIDPNFLRDADIEYLIEQDREHELLIQAETQLDQQMRYQYAEAEDHLVEMINEKTNVEDIARLLKQQEHLNLASKAPLISIEKTEDKSGSESGSGSGYSGDSGQITEILRQNPRVRRMVARMKPHQITLPILKKLMGVSAYE